MNINFKLSYVFSAASWVEVPKVSVESLQYLPRSVENFRSTRFVAFTIIGDNAVTSSIRIAQVFPDLVGKKTRAIWKVKGGVKIYN